MERPPEHKEDDDSNSDEDGEEKEDANDNDYEPDGIDDIGDGLGKQNIAELSEEDVSMGENDDEMFEG